MATSVGGAVVLLRVVGRQKRKKEKKRVAVSQELPGYSSQAGLFVVNTLIPMQP